MVCWKSLHLARGNGCSCAEFRMGRHLSLWVQPILSPERTALAWSNLLPFQSDFLYARNGNQILFYTKNLEIPQIHSSNALCSVSHGRHKILLYHSTFSLSKLRWIIMLFLTHPHALACTASDLSFIHVLGILQTVSSVRKLCLGHAAHREQKLRQDWVQARRCLGSQTGNRHSQDMKFACQKVQRSFWDRTRCCCCYCYWCALAGYVWCNENKDLKCQIWTSGEWRQTISFHLQKRKKISKTPLFLFLWGRCWWHDPSDGLAVGLHEGVIFTGS